MFPLSLFWICPKCNSNATTDSVNSLRDVISPSTQVPLVGAFLPIRWYPVIFFLLFHLTLCHNHIFFSLIFEHIPFGPLEGQIGIKPNFSCNLHKATGLRLENHSSCLADVLPLTSNGPQVYFYVS